jgi:hemerythrin superfamily protein
MFVRLESLTPEDEGPAMLDLVRRVIDSLSIHAAMEEEVFYPAIRGLLAEGGSLADHSVEEHQEVRELMGDLISMGPSAPGFGVHVARLINEVRHHVNEEEHDILPKLRTAVGEPQLVELGKRLEDARAGLTRGRAAGTLVEAGPVEPLQATEQLVDELFEVARAPAPPRRPRRDRRRVAGSHDGEVIYHVAPTDRGGWSVKAEGARRASNKHERKVEAVARGKELARRRGGRLIIHRQDLSVENETAYAK